MEPEQVNALPNWLVRDVNEWLEEKRKGGVQGIPEWWCLASAREVFEAYCEWNGIIGYDTWLWDAVKALLPHV